MALTAWNRVQLIGDFTDSQSWSVGLNFGTDTGGAGFTTEGALAQWAQGIKALNGGGILPAEVQTAISNRGRLTTIKCSVIDGTSGKETVQAQLLLGTPVVGSAPPASAMSSAIAVSLLTAHPGRQNRGRLYWPSLGMVVNGLARYSTTQCLSMAQATATFLDDVTTAAPSAQTIDGVATTAVRPCIISRAGSHATPITQTAVGDVPDVQRRRRDKEKEAYSVYAVAQ